MQFSQTFLYRNEDGVLCIGTKTPKNIKQVKVRYRDYSVTDLAGHIHQVHERVGVGL